MYMVHFVCIRRVYISYQPGTGTQRHGYLQTDIFYRGRKRRWMARAMLEYVVGVT